jgi:hypothetical protein
MTHTLKISDGTTTCDLLAGTDYKVITAGGWAPKRAQRSSSMMGGRSPYLDVDENPIALTIKGTNKGNCLTKLGTLSDLLDQAEAWAKGENVAAVYVEYWPEDSTLAASVKAVIVGPPSFGDFLQVPGHFDGDAIGGGMRLGTNNDPIYLQFRRRGLWLGATEQEADTDSIQDMPHHEVSSTFTDNFKVLCPFEARTSFVWDDSATLDDNEAYFCFTNSGTKMALIEGESWGTAAGEFADIVDADASGGYVVRFTPADTNNNTLEMDFTAYGFDTTVRRFQIFAVLANNHATTTFDTYFSWYNLDSSVSSGNTKTKVIDASTTNPRIFYWDEFALPDQLNNYKVSFNVAGSAAAGTLDIDYFVVVGIDTSTNILHMPAIQTVSASNTSSLTVIDHRLESHLTPIVYEESGSVAGLASSIIAYDGNPSLHASGNVISTIVIACDNVGSWLMNDGNSTVQCVTNVYRHKGYLTPR